MREISPPDSNGWFEGMDEAPHDDMILVVVPSSTEDGHDDFIHSLAWWDDQDEGRWDGEWRYIDMPGAGDLEPTHWKPLNLPVVYAAKEEAA